MKARRYSNSSSSDPDVLTMRKKKPYLVLIGFFLIGLMILGGVFLGGTTNEEKVEYNKHTFLFRNGGWYTSLQAEQIGFQYLPSDVEMIPSESFSFSEKVYVVFDPREFSESSSEVQTLLSFLRFAGYISSASCSVDEECGDLPLYQEQGDCVLLQSNDETKIYKEGRCVVLSADGDFGLVIHAFLFQLFNIIER